MVNAAIVGTVQPKTTWRYVICLALLAIIIAAGGCRRKPETPPTSTGEPNTAASDRQIPIAARVNDQTITRDEVAPLVEARLAPIRQRSAEVSPGYIQQREKEITREVVETLVIKSLLKAEIEKQGITVSDEAVASRLEEIAAEQVPAISSEALLAQVKQTKGQDAESYRQQIREDLAIRKLFERQYQGQAGVGADEIRQYFENNRGEFTTPDQVRASHIQFNPEDKIRAQSVLAQLQAGADFAELAKTNSVDTKTAAEGGDLGYFQRGDMEAPFDKAVFALKVGGLSDIITTTIGLHVIKVTDVRAASARTFDEAKTEIVDKLTAEKQLAIRRAYTKTLRSQANVENHLVQ